MMLQKKILIIPFLFIAIAAHCQIDSTIQNKLWIYDSNFLPLDSFQNNLPIFFEQNIPFNNIEFPITSSGSINGPLLTLSPESFINNGFQIFLPVNKHLFFTPNQFLISKKPYTSLKFALGQKREQNVAFYHSQNFGNKLNIYAKAKFYRADGFYRNQLSRAGSFETGVNKISDNGRGLTSISFLANRNFTRENGGINDSVFIEPNIEKQLININMLQASNTFTENVFTINHFLLLNKTDQFDSLVYSNKILFTFSYKESLRNYKDSLADSFYGDNGLFENSVDFNYLNSIAGGIGYIYSSNDLNFNLSANYKHNYFSTFFNRFNTNFVEFKLSGNYKISDNVLNINSGYFLFGYNHNDYYFKTNYALNKNNSVVNIFVGLNQFEAPFVYQEYNSNYFTWSNNFQKQTAQYAGVIYNFKKSIIFQSSIYSFNNLVLLGINGNPKLFSGNQSYLNNTIKYHKSFQKIKFSTKAINNFSLGTNQLLLPQLYFFTDFFYRFNPINNSLFIETGFGFGYTTKTGSWDYIPALYQFSINPVQQVFNYPQFNFITNFTVKSLNGFIRVDNFNSPFMQNVFFTAKNYPMPDLTVRFGLIWNFNN